MTLFHIRIFSVFTLQFALLCATSACGSQCIDHMYITVTFGLLTGSSRSTNLTHFPLWIWHSFWHENLWSYQGNFIYKNSLLVYIVWKVLLAALCIYMCACVCSICMLYLNYWLTFAMINKCLGGKFFFSKHNFSMAFWKKIVDKFNPQKLLSFNQEWSC